MNNSQNLQRFTDVFLKKNMGKYSIPGAAIDIVKDGKEVFKRRYGYSNIEGKIPVDPDKTVFPAASVSKMFTATAIMQLYDIATNSLNPLPFNFEEEFLNKFYPAINNKFNEIKKNLSKDFSKYEGTYRSYDGIAKSNIMKIGFLFNPSMDMKIKDNKDGTLTLNEYTSAKEEINTTLVEKEEGEFVRADGRGDFAFKINDNGKVISLRLMV
ncbi:MAG: serine hydrolase domain-containing protein [Clostridium sp.]|uniref:serine hydrolase domain-containing protein n=1 Tax=Clostridium sp. TaxID=1506 RepID=UPI003D6C7EE9